MPQSVNWKYSFFFTVVSKGFKGFVRDLRSAYGVLLMNISNGTMGTKFIKHFLTCGFKYLTASAVYQSVVTDPNRNL